MSSIFEPMRVLSDGETLYILNGDMVIKVEHPFLTNFTHQIHTDIMEMQVSVFGEVLRIPGQRSFEMNLEFKGGIPSIIDKKDILVDIFQSVSVRDLFRGINRKIEERN